jgi:metal-sulfur cluster biosynthetic enzyme
VITRIQRAAKMTQRHIIEGLSGVYLYTMQEANPSVGLIYELECDRLNRVRFTLDFEV